MAHRPRIRPFSPDQVRITRDGDCAILEAADETTASVRFELGDRIRVMTDAQILQEWNLHADAMQNLADEYEHVAVEIPVGKPQIEFHELLGAWSARGDVLRCYVDSEPGRGMPRIHIDQHELSWEELGRLVVMREGWGMRITFVPDDELHIEPEIEVREPDGQDDPEPGRA